MAREDVAEGRRDLTLGEGLLGGDMGEGRGFFVDMVVSSGTRLASSVTKDVGGHRQKPRNTGIEVECATSIV